MTRKPWKRRRLLSTDRSANGGERPSLVTLVLTCQPPCYSNAAYGNALHFSVEGKRSVCRGLVEKRAVVTFAIGALRPVPFGTAVYSPNWRESARTAACHANDSLRMHESRGTGPTRAHARATVSKGRWKKFVKVAWSIIRMNKGTEFRRFVVPRNEDVPRRWYGGARTRA